jgi:hypothetical protein
MRAPPTDWSRFVNTSRQSVADSVFESFYKIYKQLLEALGETFILPPKRTPATVAYQPPKLLSESFESPIGGWFI